jgi:hypothetical protein
MVQSEKFPSAIIDSVETPQFSDLTRWRLKVEHGAQTWHYLESDEELKQWPQTRCDKYFLGLNFVKTRPASLMKKRDREIIYVDSLLHFVRIHKSCLVRVHLWRQRVMDLNFTRNFKLRTVTGLANTVVQCM